MTVMSLSGLKNDASSARPSQSRLSNQNPKRPPAVKDLSHSTRPVSLTPRAVAFTSESRVTAAPRYKSTNPSPNTGSVEPVRNIVTTASVTTAKRTMGCLHSKTMRHLQGMQMAGVGARVAPGRFTGLFVRGWSRLPESGFSVWGNSSSVSCLDRGGENDVKTRAARRVVRGPQAAVVRCNDGAAEGRSHTGSMRLRRKECVEDLVRLLQGQHHAGIADAHRELPVFGSLRRDGELTRPIHI